MYYLAFDKNQFIGLIWKGQQRSYDYYVLRIGDKMGCFNRELRFMKTNLLEILDLKNTITEIKLPEVLNSGLDTVKDISEIKKIGQ